MSKKEGILKEKTHSKEDLSILKHEIMVPVSIFRNKPLTTFESLIFYLKDNLGYNFHQIGIMLDRDERNIWTVYNRAKKKRENEI